MTGVWQVDVLAALLAVAAALAAVAQQTLP
jgi:hypothetical protein